MVEAAHCSRACRRRFRARIALFVLVAVMVDGLALAGGAVGYHVYEDLGWLDATLNSALVITGNGPVYPPYTAEGKLVTIVHALVGVLLFAAVIAVVLSPLFHQMFHHLRRDIDGKHRLPNDRSDDDRSGQHESEQELVGARG
ncbi:MAG: two pore domain potassium channel family protein [Planctomycetota bacterium]|mgnify:CR=1 FL=1|nr:MAG: two pore domain potassium channel family protein [Planctomycetota bacterium]